MLKRQTGQRLTQIAQQIADLDRHALSLIGADPGLQNRLDILTSIPGIGELTAIALIADMPGLGQMGEKQAASLAGLAPVARGA